MRGSHTAEAVIESQHAAVAIINVNQTELETREFESMLFQNVFDLESRKHLGSLKVMEGLTPWTVLRERYQYILFFYPEKVFKLCIAESLIFQAFWGNDINSSPQFIFTNVPKVSIT